MALADIYTKTKPKMQEALDRFNESLKTIHTGRASSNLVDDILIESYGSRVSLKQVANVATPDATLVTITPWDKANLGPIESAIRESGRNLNPTNDGTTIRITLPPMSQERREEFVKLVHKMAEETRIGLRNIRKDAWEEVQKQERDGALTEDDRYGGEKELNKMIEEFNEKIMQLIVTKEKEIRTI